MNPVDALEKSRKGSGSLRESTWVAGVAALGFIAWGLWINWEHGMASRIQVALTQGGISFIATFFSTELLRKISKIVNGWGWTAVLGWIAINLMVFLAHWIFGTPELLKTMIPGMVSGVFFCVAYGRRLG